MRVRGRRRRTAGRTLASTAIVLSAIACVAPRSGESESQHATDNPWGPRSVDHKPPNASAGLSRDAPDYSLPRPPAVDDDEVLEPEFPIPAHPAIDEALAHYTSKDRGTVRTAIDRARDHWGMIRGILAREGLPQELAALVFVESGFNPLARSSAGAAGMWQFMAGTAATYGLERSWWVDERQDFVKATVAAARHLSDLHDYYKRWPLALAAYNAGMGKINAAVRRYNTTDYWELRKHRYLRKETKDYVPRFYAALRILEEPGLYGFEARLSEDGREYDYVEIPDATDLRVVANAAEVDHDEIVRLNPELRRWCTPPSDPAHPAPYRLRLPAGTAKRFERAFSAIPPDKRVSFRRHTVRPGETPSHLAKRYRTSAKVILDFNRIASARHLRAGRTIVVPVRGDGGVLTASVAPAAVEAARVRPIPRNGRHVVRARENLWTIARRYGLAVSDLIAWNGYEADPILRPGDRVRLRAATTAAEPRRADGDAYVVREGDDLPSVAARHGMDANALAFCNGLSQGARLQPGQTLRLCGDARVDAGHHIVAPGDSWWSIARTHGVSMADLLRWNDLEAGALLHPGDRVRVASGAAR